MWWKKGLSDYTHLLLPSKTHPDTYSLDDMNVFISNNYFGLGARHPCWRNTCATYFVLMQNCAQNWRVHDTSVCIGRVPQCIKCHLLKWTSTYIPHFTKGVITYSIKHCAKSMLIKRAPNYCNIHDKAHILYVWADMEPKVLHLIYTKRSIQCTDKLTLTKLKSYTLC